MHARWEYEAVGVRKLNRNLTKITPQLRAIQA